MSVKPPRWVSPTKICGTVRRPAARCTISARRSGAAATSISSNATPFFASSRFAARQ